MLISIIEIDHLISYEFCMSLIELIIEVSL